MVPQLWLLWWFSKLWTTEEACHLPLQEMYVTVTILELLEWQISLTEIVEEKHLRGSDYLNQIYNSLATLSALQCFGFFWTPPVEVTCLQELHGTLGLNCQLTSKTGHLQKTEVAFNQFCIFSDGSRFHYISWITPSVCFFTS